MSNKKRAKKKYRPKLKDYDCITVREVQGIRVTEDPIHVPGKEKFREKDEDFYSQSYECLGTDPQRSAAIIESLLERYPDHPTLITNLSAAYTLLGKTAQAFELSKTNYEKNYFYPMARISYASSLIRRKSYLEIPKIFDYHLIINRVFPSRAFFHASEVVGFSHVMLQYHIHHSDYEEAALHRLILKEFNEEQSVSSFHMFLAKIQSKLQTPLRY